MRGWIICGEMNFLLWVKTSCLRLLIHSGEVETRMTKRALDQSKVVSNIRSLSRTGGR